MCLSSRRASVSRCVQRMVVLQEKVYRLYGILEHQRVYEGISQQRETSGAWKAAGGQIDAGQSYRGQASQRFQPEKATLWKSTNHSGPDRLAYFADTNQRTRCHGFGQDRLYCSFDRTELPQQILQSHLQRARLRLWSLHSSSWRADLSRRPKILVLLPKENYRLFCVSWTTWLYTWITRMDGKGK